MRVLTTTISSCPHSLSLVAGIHVLLDGHAKNVDAGTSPAMRAFVARMNTAICGSSRAQMSFSHAG